jgi:hypothetical protein
MGSIDEYWSKVTSRRWSALMYSSGRTMPYPPETMEAVQALSECGREQTAETGRCERLA